MRLRDNANELSYPTLENTSGRKTLEIALKRLSRTREAILHLGGAPGWQLPTWRCAG